MWQQQQQHQYHLDLHNRPALMELCSCWLTADASLSSKPAPKLSCELLTDWLIYWLTDCCCPHLLYANARCVCRQQRSAAFVFRVALLCSLVLSHTLNLSYLVQFCPQHDRTWAALTLRVLCSRRWSTCFTKRGKKGRGGNERKKRQKKEERGNQSQFVKTKKTETRKKKRMDRGRRSTKDSQAHVFSCAVKVKVVRPLLASTYTHTHIPKLSQLVGDYMRAREADELKKRHKIEGKEEHRH